jgi:hypothetical protein
VNDDEVANSYPPEFRAAITAALRERQARAEANSKRQNRWGGHFEGQRLPDYRVAVTTSGRGKKKHTFVLVPDEEEVPSSPLHWERVTKTIREHLSPGTLVVSLSEPLPEVVHLAESVDVPLSTLTVILDALVSASQHKIGLDEVNYIVSQHSPRIAKFCALPAETRRLAESALYSTILATLF